MRVLLIILLLAFGGISLAAQASEPDARRIVERPEYKGYRIEKPKEGGADGDAGSDSGESSGGTRRGTGAEGTPRRGTGADGPSRGSSGGGDGLSLPAWIATLFEIVAWVVMIGAALVAVFFIVKALLGIKRKPKQKSDKSKKTKKEAPEGEVVPADAEEPIAASVFEDALVVALREYQEALAREDFAGATLLGYRVFWLRAGWRGCVESEDVRTWRDALRMVRAMETRRDVRGLLPMVERVRYADYKPNRTEFNAWSLSLERIEPSGVLK